MIGYTFDAGALIALDRGNAQMRSMVAVAVQRGQVIRVPAAVVAQVWREPARQVRLVNFLAGPHVQHVSMDLLMAKAAGLLCKESGITDVADASVAVCARLHDDEVVTSDPDDMRRLVDPARVVSV